MWPSQNLLSKFIPHRDIDVIVAVQVSEWSCLTFSTEDVGPHCSPQGVGEAVADLRDDLIVLIRRAEEGEEGEAKGLVAEELGQANREELPQPVLGGKAGGQGVP